MSKSNTHETEYLRLIYNGTPIANIADDAAADPLTSIFIAFHTADPGDAGNQSTNEATYTGYTRVAVPRDNTGFTVTDDTCNLTSVISGVQATAGSEVLTHFSTGVAVSGVTKILHAGPLTSPITIAAGATPKLGVSTSITED